MDSLFELAIKAKIPFIGTTYSDTIHFLAVLQEIVQKPVLPLPKNSKYTVGDAYTYWTEKIEEVTADMYKKLCNSGASCVVLNQPENNIVFNAGPLPTPEIFYKNYLKEIAEEDQINPIIQSISGMALKDAQAVISLTMARAGSILPAEIKKTRAMLEGHTPGLEELSTDYSFYVMPKDIEGWLDLNKHYFLAECVIEKLRPRGLMVVGAAGTGKSTLATVIANQWGVPLFRSDISSVLTKWLGQSEERFSRCLSTLEQNSPCIWLLDEVEKLFITEGNEGTVTRILSQLLWWLQNHKGRIFVVMTSNGLDHVPKELYRPGRIDKVLRIYKLTELEARAFAVNVYEYILGEIPSPSREKTIRYNVLTNEGLSHAEVIEIVIDLIKEKHWDSLLTNQG